MIGNIHDRVRTPRGRVPIHRSHRGAAPVEAALLGPRRRALRAANKARRGVLKAAQNTAKKIARPIRGLGKKIGMKIARPFRALRLGKRMKSRRQ